MRQRIVSAAQAIRIWFFPPLVGALLAISLAPACGDDDTTNNVDATTPDSAQPDTGQPDGAQPDADGVDAAPVDGAEPDGGGFVCDPPAETGSLYELEANFKEMENPVSNRHERGEVVLLVNVAALCGYTYQFGGLAQLQSNYESQGVTVLGFYCDQFMNQAGSLEQQQNAEDQYGVNFPVSEIINVNAPNEHPIYTWLKSQPGGSGEIGWNFVKFLVSRDGELLGRWDTGTEPTDTAITSAIDSAL